MHRGWTDQYPLVTIRQSRLYWTGARRWRVRERGSREMNMKTCLQMST